MFEDEVAEPFSCAVGCSFLRIPHYAQVCYLQFHEIYSVSYGLVVILYAFYGFIQQRFLRGGGCVCV